jgi:hypothetical protein
VSGCGFFNAILIKREAILFENGLVSCEAKKNSKITKTIFANWQI